MKLLFMLKQSEEVKGKDIFWLWKEWLMPVEYEQTGLFLP